MAVVNASSLNIVSKKKRFTEWGDKLAEAGQMAVGEAVVFENCNYGNVSTAVSQGNKFAYPKRFRAAKTSDGKIAIIREA